MHRILPILKPRLDDDELSTNGEIIRVENALDVNAAPRSTNIILGGSTSEFFSYLLLRSIVDSAASQTDDDYIQSLETEFLSNYGKNKMLYSSESNHRFNHLARLNQEEIKKNGFDPSKPWYLLENTETGLKEYTYRYKLSDYRIYYGSSTNSKKIGEKASIVDAKDKFLNSLTPFKKEKPTFFEKTILAVSNVNPVYLMTHLFVDLGDGKSSQPLANVFKSSYYPDYDSSCDNFRQIGPNYSKSVPSLLFFNSATNLFHYFNNNKESAKDFIFLFEKLDPNTIDIIKDLSSYPIYATDVINYDNDYQGLEKANLYCFTPQAKGNQVPLKDRVRFVDIPANHTDLMDSVTKEMHSFITSFKDDSQTYCQAINKMDGFIYAIRDLFAPLDCYPEKRKQLEDLMNQIRDLETPVNKDLLEEILSDFKKLLISLSEENPKYNWLGRNGSSLEGSSLLCHDSTEASSLEGFFPKFQLISRQDYFKEHYEEYVFPFSYLGAKANLFNCLDKSRITILLYDFNKSGKHFLNHQWHQAIALQNKLDRVNLLLSDSARLAIPAGEEEKEELEENTLSTKPTSLEATETLDDILIANEQFIQDHHFQSTLYESKSKADDNIEVAGKLLFQSGKFCYLTKEGGLYLSNLDSGNKDRVTISNTQVGNRILFPTLQSKSSRCF
jgi:mRNA-degrading endonuclease RelE of RelBE toxin-antitoxin system